MGGVIFMLLTVTIPEETQSEEAKGMNIVEH